MIWHRIMVAITQTTVRQTKFYGLGLKRLVVINRRHEDGFALPSVLVIAIILSLLAIALSTLAQVLATDSSAFSSAVDGQAAIEAGLNRMILAFARLGDPLREQLAPDGRPVPWDFHGRTLRLRAQAESGKLDLNAADRTHITALLDRLVEEPALRSQLLARIDSQRQLGARMTSVAELLPPFDRMTATADLLSTYFTVMTDQKGIDPMTAPSLVIETLPGLPDGLKTLILEVRAARRPLPLAEIPAPVAQSFAAERPIYTFHAQTSAGFNRAMALSAVVGFSEQSGISVYAWAPASVQK
jgi:hypothetical protein